MDRWWERVSPQRRIDFNLGNMFMLLGLLFPSLSIMLQGPVPNSTLSEMPEWLQVFMCVLIFFGCGMKLHGALAHRRFYFCNTSLKRCYRYGVAGAPAATSGLLVYGYFLLSSTPTFLSAMSTMGTTFFGIGISGQAVLYWLEARRIERNELEGTDKLIHRLENDSQ